MQSYLVGGAVRDHLLQQNLGQAGDRGDRDWVVVGSTPAEMESMGFQPVGKDFPVFLHPQTREEYALARTERKSGKGYKGFIVHADPHVTLEEDLARRDLTINAVALPAALVDTAWYASDTIDPYGGARDLEEGVLRHVTEAFAEDPVRVLRVARFAARWPHMRIAPETRALMRQMVSAGEIDALVPERVWQEMSRALMTRKPSRFFEVLQDCGALDVLWPELARLWGVPQRADYHPEVDTGIHTMMVLDHSAHIQAELFTRFACLCHDLGKGTTPLEVLPRHLGHEERSVQLARQMCERWRVPHEGKQLAETVAREHGNIHRSGDFSADAIVRLLERCDAFRRPDRFEQVLIACECDARGRLGLSETPYPQRGRLTHALLAAQSVDTASISASVTQSAPTQGLGAHIGRAVQAARIAAVAAALSI